MGALRIIVLALAVGASLVSVRRIPTWAATLAVAAVAGIAGIVPRRIATGALGDLAPALAFLVVAVPLALVLDETGFFAAVATRFDSGRHLLLSLWLLAAATTIVFNLDAAVVLLTPLYVRIADRHGLDPVAVGAMPALQASLASSVLPVSNLTNLVALEHVDPSLRQFVGQMLLPSVVAITLGGAIHLRRIASATGPPAVEAGADQSSLPLGIAVVVWLLAGFTVGGEMSIPPWAVAGAALVVLMLRRRRVPWQAVPVEAVAVATGLGVVAAGAASHLPIDELIGLGGVGGELATFGAFAVGANAVNNLPAVLLAAPSLEAQPDRLWPVLLGVNLGPTIWVTGALSTLLWQSTMARLGHRVPAGTYVRFGARVGVPVLAVTAGCRALQVWLG